MKGRVLKKLIKEAFKEVSVEDDGGPIKEMIKEGVREVVKEEMKTIVREAVLSEGALSSIIAESVSGVMQGTGGAQRQLKENSGGRQGRTKKTPQNQKMTRLSDNFKKQFNDVDITEDIDQSDVSKMPNLTNNAMKQQSSGGGNQKIKQLEQQVMNGNVGGANSAQAQQQVPQQGGGGGGMQPGVSRMSLSSNKDDKDFINKLKKGKQKSKKFQEKLAKQKLQNNQ